MAVNTTFVVSLLNCIYLCASVRSFTTLFGHIVLKSGIDGILSLIL